MPEVDINLLAVLVAGVVTMIVGAIWYAKPVTGKIWMSLANLTEEQMKEGAPVAFGGSFVLALLSAYVLSHVVDYVGATDWVAGAQTGAWMWLGFVATATLTTTLYENRPFKLWMLYGGYQLVSLVVTGALLAVWV